MVRHTKPQHRSQPAQEPALPYTRQPSFSAKQTHIVDDHGERVCVQSSKQGEFHPKLLTEPYVNLSIHTALQENVFN